MLRGKTSCNANEWLRIERQMCLIQIFVSANLASAQKLQSTDLDLIPTDKKMFQAIRDTDPEPKDFDVGGNTE